MKSVLKREDIIIHGMICLLMTFSLVYVIGGLMQVEFNGPQRFFIALVMGVPTQLLILYPFLLYPFMLLGTVAIVAIYRVDPQIVIGAIQWMAQFMDNIIQHMKGNELIAYENATAFWILITLLVSLGTAWAIFRCSQGRWILLSYLILFLYYWYTYVSYAYGMMVLFLICYFTWIGLDQYRRKEEAWRCGRKDQVQMNKSYWRSVATLYSVLIMIMALLIPKPTGQLHWSWLNHQVSTAFPTITALRDDVSYRRDGQGGLFDFSTTGFQSTPGRLGGPVKLDHTPIMRVKSPQPLYLRGNIRAIYDGSKWRDGEKIELDQDPTVDNLEAVHGQLVTLEITHEDLFVRTVFAPQGVQEIILGDGELMIYDDYEVYVKGTIDPNRSYKVKSLIPTGIGESMNQLPDEYLQVPKTLPQRVIQLTAEVVKDASSPYEKAQTIENYLQNNYPYTLSAERVPQYEDFVDHFLFETQRGYCTYYATAMAVMLRTQGIPTRYIEGYRMPKEHEDGIYTITQANAHAWVEAYIEGHGWMTFEPTAAFPRLTPEMPRSESRNPEAQSVLDEMEMLMQSVFNATGAEGSQGGLPIEGALPSSAEMVQEETGIWNWFKLNTPLLVAILFCGIIPIRIFYQNRKLKSQMKRLREKSEKEQIPYLYQWTLGLLAKLGDPIHPGETPYEYAQRITRKSYRGEEDFRDLTMLYMEVKYSPREATVEERDRILNHLEQIDQKLRYHLGIWRYSYIKYIKSGYYQ